MSEHSKDSAGFDPARLEAARALLTGWVDEGVLPAAAALVMRDGETAAEWYLGEAIPGSGKPPDERTLFPLASITKPMTASLIMTFVEDGRISLDEPVNTVLPELARPDTERITLRHLLTHTSGLPGFPAENAALRAARQPLERFVEVFLRTPPRFGAGSQFCYSNVGVGLLGEIAARLAGASYPDALRERVLRPWGLADAFLPVPESEQPRVANVRDSAFPGTPHETSNSPYFRGLGIPWGGMYASLRAVAAFAQPFLAVARGHDAPAPLSPATRRAMVASQVEVPPAAADDRDDMHAEVWPRIAWGLGWELKGPRRPHFTGELTSAATFGHRGASGTCVWADPATGVLVVFLANRALARWADTPPRQARFANAVMAAAR